VEIRGGNGFVGDEEFIAAANAEFHGGAAEVDADGGFCSV
jgi:hypothetical protein